jgi:hypothetical protein
MGDWIVGLIQGLAGQYPLVAAILVALGGLVVIGQAVVVATPSTEDDKWWDGLKSKPLIGPLIALLANFAPFHKADS